MAPDYRYTTPIHGTPGEAVPTEFDDVDTALIATNPDFRGPEDVKLFERSAEVRPTSDVDTDKIEVFPETARMITEAERAAKWEVVGQCHDAMTEAGISLAQASEIMARVVAQVGLVSSEGPSHRGPNGTMRPEKDAENASAIRRTRPHGDAPHATLTGLAPAPKPEK